MDVFLADGDDLLPAAVAVEVMFAENDTKPHVSAIFQKRDKEKD